MTHDEVVLCVCYCLFSIGTYIVWPSRWNVLAHLNLGFCVVAYIVPLLVLHQDQKYAADEIATLRHDMVLGAWTFVPALLVGAFMASHIAFDLNASRAYLLSKMDRDKSARRLVFVLVVGIVLTCIAAVAMGGLPLFSADPLAAKYFRGASAVSGKISVIYRLGTCILTVLPPLTIAMAFTDRKRRKLWLVLSAAAILLMIASLQRGAMAHGALIAVVVLLIYKRHYFWAAAMIFGAYCVGAVFYIVLHSLGIGTLTPGASDTFWRSVAAGAPDVTDTLSFLRAWVSQGQPMTHGNTMWGGLVPGHYHWNSAVWALTTENPGTNVNAIGSGGLRLPAPVWGLVSFGHQGIYWMSGLIGLVQGFVTRRFAMVINNERGVLGVVVMTMLLGSMYATVGQLSNLSYLDVLNLLILLWVLWPSLSAAAADRRGVRPGGIVRGPRPVDLTARRASATRARPAPYPVRRGRL